MITTTGLTRIYGKGENAVTAVNNLDIRIDDGELVAITGKSGSGKTTLLNILGGLDKATGGSVCYDDTDITKLADTALADFRLNKIGFVFQFYNLIPNLTALENVELALQICKNPMDAKEVLEEVGLGDRLDNFPAQLSGGEQQRVAIARALVNHPVLLLADEPTGNLDPVTAKGIMELLSEINKSGTTVLVVTHNKELVNEMGKRVILIEDGHIEQDEIRGSYDI